MDARRMEALEHRIEAAMCREVEAELNATVTDDLQIVDLAPWRASTRILLRKISALHDGTLRSG